MTAQPIFIVWANRSQRAQTLATELEGRVSLQFEAKLTGRWFTPLRYLIQGWKTWRLLERERPAVVLVQSPPIFAPLIVVLWCALRGKLQGSRIACAIDCHPSTFHSRNWRWALPLLRFLARRATVTLSSNMDAERTLQSWQVRGFFLADGIPFLPPATGTTGTEGETRVAVISTFDADEPMAEVFAAARLLPHITFYVTGDPQRASTLLLAQKPGNVILTGFLRGGDFTALLQNVDGLAILTKQPKDLSCAAYEAVAVEKPAVISERSENKRYFTGGFIYVENTPEAIAQGIQKMLDEQATLVPAVIALRAELTARRQPRVEKLVALLNGES